MFESSGASHHNGLQIGCNVLELLMDKSSIKSISFNRVFKILFVASETSLPNSQGGMENCMAGMKQFACAHRTNSSFEGPPAYALPPIISGKHKGYPTMEDVNKCGIKLRNPFEVVQELNVSPILVHTPEFVE